MYGQNKKKKIFGGRMEKKTKMEKMEIKKNKILLEDLSYIYKNTNKKYFNKKKL